MIDSVGRSGVDVMVNLYETGYGIVVSAAEEESERGDEFGFLDAKFFK